VKSEMVCASCQLIPINTVVTINFRVVGKPYLGITSDVPVIRPEDGRARNCVRILIERNYRESTGFHLSDLVRLIGPRPVHSQSAWREIRSPRAHWHCCRNCSAGRRGACRRERGCPKSQ